MGRKYYLNKRDGKLMGVCAGLADYTGLDVLWIRIAAVLAVLVGFGLLLIVYPIIGLIADKRPEALDDPLGRARAGLGTGDARWREHDGTLGDVESYYSASNPRLSREIDDLR